MTEFSREDLDGGVTVLTISRPPVNALTADLLERLDEVLTEIEKDASVRAVILASGLRVFSAGMDLKQAKEFSRSEQTAIVDGLNQTLVRLYGLPKPVIAAVNGAAIAGGLFLVLASDYSVIRQGVTLGLTEVRVGLSFPVAPLEIAKATLAPAALRRLLLSGRNLDADAARDSGVVDEVVADDPLARAREVALDYASVPPIAFSAVKTQVRAQSLRTIRQSVRDKSDPARAGWFSEETRDAMVSLLEAATRK